MPEVEPVRRLPSHPGLSRVVPSAGELLSYLRKSICICQMFLQHKDAIMHCAYFNKTVLNSSAFLVVLSSPATLRRRQAFWRGAGSCQGGVPLVKTSEYSTR